MLLYLTAPWIPAVAQSIQNSEQSVVIAGVPADFPPQYSIDEHGQPQGFAIDVMELVARQAGLRVEYQVFDNWKEVMSALEQGEVQLVPNLGITEPRHRIANFTSPVETFSISAFVRKESSEIQTLADLNGKLVGVIQNNAAVRIVEKREGVSTRLYQSFHQALLELVSGRIDVLAYPEPVVWKMSQGAGLDHRIRVLSPPLKEIKRGIAVSKREYELFKRLEQTVQGVITGDEYQQIFSRWYSRPTPFWTVNRVFWLMAVVIGLILLWRHASLVKLNHSLRLEVRQRYQAEEAMKRADQAKDEFLASVSHELRTPLTAIIGNSEILSETPLNAAQQDVLQTIKISSRRQLALVNDILDLSKIGSGKFAVNGSPFDLDALISDVQHLFSTQAGGETVRFRVEQEVHFSSMLMGDGQRIGQVLINLLSNAFKFTERGEIVLTVRRESDFLAMSVSDQGIGMAPDVLERLFYPFEQADDSISGRFGGTGLGLHISRILVELMGGTITVESEEGKGSFFQFTVPLAESGVLLDPKAVQLQHGLPCFRGDVLVAEDTPEIQDIERKLLEEVGLEVTIARNGREAIELVAKHAFDLILMDMQMPEVDGIEATRAIRANGVTTPVIAVTANVMQTYQDQILAAGCSGLVSKPFVRDDLHEILAGFLERVERAEITGTDGSGESTTMEQFDRLLDRMGIDHKTRYE